MSSELFHFQPGNSALVVSCPHPGTFVPDAILNRMSDAGRRLIDTDWHVDKLYDFLPEFDATFIRANVSRYVADLNRDPEGHALYPGRFETAMCPVVTFAGEAIYRRGEELSNAEIAERHVRYWQPYHAKLVEALAATKARHGFALLLDAHSILSRVPSLFEGSLPDLNLGTADGKSCVPAIERAAADALQRQSKFSFVANGRFKGGYITRHYGNPAKHVHALQLEISFCAYLNEENFTTFDKSRAEPLRNHLRQFVGEIVKAAHSLYPSTEKRRS
jgi:N-formylglutamate deformylase